MKALRQTFKLSSAYFQRLNPFGGIDKSLSNIFITLKMLILVKNGCPALLRADSYGAVPLPAQWEWIAPLQCARQGGQEGTWGPQTEKMTEKTQRLLQKANVGCIVNDLEAFRPERSPWEMKQSHEWDSLWNHQHFSPTGVGNNPGRRFVPPWFRPLWSPDIRVYWKKKKKRKIKKCIFQLQEKNSSSFWE